MAKIVACRCEDVTLHDLDQAIALGFTDIESLKRYSGFGTGWCQGRGCIALCARRLAEKGGACALPITPRPPVRPLALGDLVGLASVAEQDEEAGTLAR